MSSGRGSIAREARGPLLAKWQVNENLLTHHTHIHQEQAKMIIHRSIHPFLPRNNSVDGYYYLPVHHDDSSSRRSPAASALSS